MSVYKHSSRHLSGPTTKGQPAIIFAIKYNLMKKWIKGIIKIISSKRNCGAVPVYRQSIK